MSEYYAEVKWSRGQTENFIDNKYSRGHSWKFDGGVTVEASSSPHVVPLPYSVEANVDPEEAFVASLSSCHMLFFLSIAAKRKFIVDGYADTAVGIMEKNGDTQPTMEQIERMHHQAHEQCFIANSVNTKIIIDIVA